MSGEHFSPGAEEPVFKRAEGVDFAPWSEAQNEHRETMPDQEVAFTFIKPGFEQHQQEIVDILRDNGLEVIYADRIRLTPEAVDYMYQEAADEHFYPTMKQHLTSHDVTMIMVGGKGHDAQEILSGLKKTRDGKDGIIRQMLKQDNILPQEDFEQWRQGTHPEQDQITILLSQGNVIHTADNTQEAVESLRILLGDKFNELRIRGALPSELWTFFKEEKGREEQA